MIKKVLAENAKIAANQEDQTRMVRNLKTQMGQIVAAQVTRPNGALPSDTKPPNKAQVSAVTLRSGKELH